VRREVRRVILRLRKRLITKIERFVLKAYLIS
jgi:hypothetical protein